MFCLFYPSSFQSLLNWPRLRSALPWALLRRSALLWLAQILSWLRALFLLPAAARLHIGLLTNWRSPFYLSKCPPILTTRLMYNCAHLRSTKESLILEYDTWWYWVIKRWYWLVLGGTGTVWGGTGSVWGGTGWFSVVLGQYQYGAVMVGSLWYWVSKGRCFFQVMLF